MQKPLIRAIALIAILALAIAFAGCAKQPQQQASPTPKTNPSASPTATLKPIPFAAKQDYDYGKYLLHSERLTTAPDEEGVSTDEETISNEGPETAKFSVAEVFPQTKLSDADAAAMKDGKMLATRHLVLSPLTQLTDVELGKNERVSFSARSQTKNLAEKTPVRLVTEPDLTAFQRSKLLPALAKIAELNLGLPQAKAFEETVNKAFAKIKQQQNPFEDYVDAVEEYADEVHDEIEAAQRATPPKPTPKIEQIKFTAPTPPKTPTKAELGALLPQMPPVLEFKLSEKKLSDTKPLDLQAKTYLGNILYSVEGDAAPYLSVSAETMGNNYLLLVKANVRKAMKDKKISFDSKQAKICASFSLAPDLKIFTSVSIVIKHVEASAEEQTSEENSVEELPMPTPTPKQPEGGLPEEPVAKPNIEPQAPDKIVYENFEKAKTGYVSILGVPMQGQPDTATIEKYHPGVMENYAALCRKMGFEPKTAGCKIGSGYRDREYNVEQGGVADSAHLYGLALDIGVYGWRNQLEWAQAAQGIFSRAGIYCDSTKGIHVDMMPDRCPYVRDLNGKTYCADDFEDQKRNAEEICG
ncbi:MAG: D-Ala-D-Ala carboxypeptidase family metallohydrolase [Candidatus Micrarchaeota archaeon]